mmetsp:Transcript_173926/g.557493  ORF Transcript_173926/g.557493 Transcript_173926/m.557493 type:complete len:205 (+) Transcript_173926:820-1434(+)
MSLQVRLGRLPSLLGGRSSLSTHRSPAVASSSLSRLACGAADASASSVASAGGGAKCMNSGRSRRSGPMPWLSPTEGGGALLEAAPEWPRSSLDLLSLLLLPPCPWSRCRWSLPPGAPSLTSCAFRTSATRSAKRLLNVSQSIRLPRTKSSSVSCSCCNTKWPPAIKSPCTSKECTVSFEPRSRSKDWQNSLKLKLPLLSSSKI